MPIDQVLEARLERRSSVDVDRAEDVQRDREPLERRGTASSGCGLEQEAHAGGGRGEQRVVLGDVRAAHRSRVRDEHGERRRRRAMNRRRQRRGGRARSRRRRTRRVRRCGRRRSPRRRRPHEARERDERAEIAARASAGTSTAASSADGGRGEQRQRRREREPVDVRRRRSRAARRPASSGAERRRDGRIGSGVGRRDRRAGRDRAARPTGEQDATSGTSDRQLAAGAGPGRRPRPPSRRPRCSTPEISRSMYIAASTIATAPTTA